MTADRVEAFAEKLFIQFKTRMWKKEKEPFVEYCSKAFEELGYAKEDIVVHENRGIWGAKSRNLYIGPKDAEVLVTAHYDTPGRTGFFLLFNPIFGGLLGSIVLAVPVGIFFGFISRTPYIIFDIFHLLCIFLFFLIFFLKNPNNHNDNSSGVIGVYKIAELVSADSQLKKRCAFILFDHEEIMPGMVGSSAFAKWCKKNRSELLSSKVINLDCIGTGEVLTVMANKKHPFWNEITEYFVQEGFTAKKIRGGLAANSDHAPFKNGVSLLYQRKSLLGPMYIPNLHFSKDRECDVKQIENLCLSVYKYLSKKD